MLLFAIPKKVPLSGKERLEIENIYQLNGQNAAQTLSVYQKNHVLCRSMCTVKAVWGLIYKFEETGCICDRLRSGRPSVPVETIVEVHQTISRARSTSVSRVLHLPISTGRKILRCVLNMFPCPFQRSRCWELETINYSQILPIRYDEETAGFYAFSGELRHISR